jgi:hypothetical protein
MPYVLNFSDPGNLNRITVPDYPPGLNTVDTSLSFIGKSYPNYGQVVDQNFLKLLENFAGPLQPSAAIKGQLWYDSFSRTLKLFDGNTWKSANGIYQQATNPEVTSAVSQGDIWVDTSTNLLKIRGVGSWIQIGLETQGSGVSVATLNDLLNAPKTVLYIKVDNKVAAIFNPDNEFTPLTYLGELQNNGFTGNIVKGITLPDGGILKGTADDALKLGGIVSTSYLRKNDTSAGGQLITGKMVYVTPPTSGQEGRDGVIIRTSSDNPVLSYIQFFKKGNDAVILNQVKGGKIILKTWGIGDTDVTESIAIEKNLITVKGNLSVNSGTVSASTLTGTLSTAAQPNITSVGTLTNLTVSGSVSCVNFVSSGTATIGDLFVTGRAVLPPLYTAGSLQLWAGSTATAIPAGWLVCDGIEVSTSTYKSLFDVIGFNYGIPVTEGTFRLPNLVVNVPLPAGDPRGATTATYYIIKQD